MGLIINVDKEKLLVEFEEKYVENRWIDEFIKIDEIYKKNKEKIEKDISITFEKLCKEAIALQEKGLKGAIRYIYFSLLRTSVLENKGEYRIDFYDENWVLDKEECSANIDLNFIYNSLFKHMDELSELKKSFSRYITDMDIEYIKLKECENYHVLAVEFLKEIIEVIINSSSYDNLKKTDDIRILSGEYMDECEVIYPKRQIDEQII